MVKVDVEINGLDETAEEAVGAYLAYVADTDDGAITEAGTNAMVNVRFTCEPTDLPPDEMVTVENKGQGRLYLVEGDLLYLVTSTNLPARGIDKRTFLLHGHAASGAVLKDEITIEHPSSKAKDLAKYTVVEFDFIAISRNRRPGSSFNQLTDNREADITITLKPTGVDPSHFSLNFKSEPVESGDLINKKGTNITFIPSASPLIWSTSPVYWYGVKPDKECHHYEYAYRFILKESGMPVKEREYKMCWPDENPRMLRNPVSQRSASTISPPSLIARALPGGTLTNCYVCKIVFGGFEKNGILVDLPTTDQYSLETQREEEYHLRQWRGTVPSQEGGTTDCFTAKGVRFFAKKYAEQNSLDFSMDGGDMLIFGSDPTNACGLASVILSVADSDEIAESDRIWYADRGFIELKAKQYAGYNAAWRYHCVYEALYGPNPVNNVHPAYADP